MAIDIARFEKVSTFKRRLQQMMDEVRREPRFDRKIPILVAGDPEKNSFRERSKKGIPVGEELLEEFNSISTQLNVFKI